jgi:hypothetical protein
MPAAREKKVVRTVYQGPLGTRTELRLDGEEPLAMIRFSVRHDVEYWIDERERSVREVSIAGALAAASTSRFSVQRHEPARVGARRCEHVTLNGNRGEVVEVWLAEGLEQLEFPALSTASSAVISAVRATGLRGSPVRATLRFPEKGGALTEELVSIERRHVPLSKFDITRFAPKKSFEEHD